MMADEPDDATLYWSPARPLAPLNEADRDHTMQRLRRRASAQQAAARLALTMQDAARQTHQSETEETRRHLELAQALRQAGRMTHAEYVIQVGSRLERLSESRWEDGDYAADLGPIDDAMRVITEAHGLSEDEYWRVVDQPDDYRELSEAYSGVLVTKLIAIMREFGEDALAELRETDPGRYKALREEGRRAIFEQDNRLSALSTLIDHYEKEAEAAGSAGAYMAGCLMWGAAVEARLLLWCLRAPEAAETARMNLPSRRRPRSADPADWGLDTLARVTKAAGWIGVLGDEDFIFLVEALIHELRQTRNLVHPGRALADAPHLRRDLESFNDARTAYAALRMNEAEYAPPAPPERSILPGDI